LHLLRRAFPYCTCPSKIRHKRKCVNAEIGKCLGFCCADIAHTKKDIASYRANIAAIKKVLSGKTKTLERELAAKMATLAAGRRYEQAAIARNQIGALGSIFRHSPYLKKDMPEERARALRALQELLHLPRTPTRIECYDISHHHGDTSVASMVVFENGAPAKSEYRKFIIRRVTGINDPAMFHEILSRRLTHREWQLPDLIIVDGGKAQLGAVLRALKTSDVLRPSVAAIAKREEEFYIPGIKAPVRLKTLPPPLFHLITHLRDEAHRFAVTFHRKRRSRLVIRRKLPYT
jgi:excinuclease ABC subunit C